MNDAIYSDLALERLVKDHFGLKVDVSKVIVRQASGGPSIEATLFLSEKKQLYLFVHAQSAMTLGDVKKVVARMGLKAELFLPPKGHPDYFDTIAREKFRIVFPGRGHITDNDLIFYRTLAPYNPALILISEVKTGEVKEFNRDTHGGWRVAAKFAYRRIKTS